MFKPFTLIGKQFSEECIKLNSYFINRSKIRIITSVDKELSFYIEEFFNSINTIPSKIAQSEYSLTELFEIDQSIMGTYGSKLFIEELDLPLKNLLKDIIALWFRYELLGFLERRDATFFDISGVRSYYNNWLHKERVGIEVTEYERIIQNVAFLLENKENLETSTRILLFNVLGKILITLGVYNEDADRNLQKYINDINERQNPSSISYAEILLNLFVLNFLQVDLKKIKYVKYNELIKAIKFWSSRDEFSEKLYKSWEIYWENDYYSELNNDEKEKLIQNKNSLYNYLERTNLNIGHSFLDFYKNKSNQNNFMNVYKPASIFIFGGAGVGKTTFINAFCYNVQMNISKKNNYNSLITLGKDLQVFFQENSDNWFNKSIKPTISNKEFSFWEDLNLLNFTIHDYPGKDLRSDQWDSNLQNLFQKSKALIFFIDEKDYLNEVNLRRKSSIFNLFLEYWMASNPGVRHAPIALVLSKFDLVIPNLSSSLQRSTLVPSNLNAASIEEFFENRFYSDTKELRNNSYERFCDMILNDKSNNSCPELQDIVSNLLSNLAPFIQRILDLTYNYQIFITSSHPPEFNGDTNFPYGVREPLNWICKSLEKIYIKESLNIYENEEEIIKNSISEGKDDILKMYKLNTLIEEMESEYREIADTRNPIKLALFYGKKDTLNKEILSTEEKLKKISQKYGFELNTHNRKETIKKIENLINDKNSILVALEEKKGYLINKIQ